MAEGAVSARGPFICPRRFVCSERAEGGGHRQANLGCEEGTAECQERRKRAFRPKVLVAICGFRCGFQLIVRLVQQIPGPLRVAVHVPLIGFLGCNDLVVCL